jgi:hypothetical protein
LIARGKSKSGKSTIGGILNPHFRGCGSQEKPAWISSSTMLGSENTSLLDKVDESEFTLWERSNGGALAERYLR